MTKKKEMRTRAEAKKLMWEYYSKNKASLPKWIRECREEILSELMNGTDVDRTFESMTVFETPIGEIGASVGTMTLSTEGNRRIKDAA
jgi:hypothetical protein